ncbi:MAG TPA: Hsp70 family protein [Candidatus Dormibacteraeota bacterium]|nr:Hsp70 family protein [Candidatus Dormibacteraeota bacterium]
MTSRRPIGCGIDFGTSNSAIAVAYADGVEVVPAESGLDGLTLASVAYLHRDGDRRAGEAAIARYLVQGHLHHTCLHCPLVRYGAETDCRQATRNGGCQDTRLVTGVKRDLARTDFTGTHSWARDFELPELVSIVIERLKRSADEASGADIRRVVLGHPVVFPGVEMGGRSQQVALDRLAEGARQAGFEEVALYPEPAAAVLGERLPEGHVLAVDFGGGTFDAAVIEVRAGVARTLALTGVDIGGERFDAALFEAVVGPALELTSLPNWLYNEMGSRSGVRQLLSDPGVPKVLDRIGGKAAEVARAILFEGHAWEFYKAVEDAKIRLSAEEVTRLRFVRRGVRLDVPLLRGQFEAVIKEDLEEVERCLLRAVVEAGLEPGQVTSVLRTGGSSRLPSFQHRLDALFGDRVSDRDAFTAVAKGLGARAAELWG